MSDASKQRPTGCGDHRDHATRPNPCLLTAVDLGSNSFCLMQGVVRANDVDVRRFQRDSVRLVAGIDEHGVLDRAHREHALAWLRRTGEMTRTLPAHAVRAVATSAVRRLADPEAFLQQAAAALGQPVEMIDGSEEGRLIWVGASGALAATDRRRLVIDIGGGSTELVAGHGIHAAHIASINIGCIVARSRYFADGQITPARWQHALTDMGRAIAPQREELAACGWDEAWATSGSARAIAAIVHALGTCASGIDATAVADLKQRLIQAGHIERLHLPALDADGREVVAGTVAVLDALFQSLQLTHMGLCESAMREGILLDLAQRRP